MMVMKKNTLFQLLILCAFAIVTSQSRAVNVTDVRKDDNQVKKPFSLEETYLHFFYSFGFNDRWISDNEIMVVVQTLSKILITDVTTGKTKQFFDRGYLPMKYTFKTAVISSNRQYILFGYNYKQVFRYSTIKHFVVYDRNHNQNQNQTRNFTEIADEAFISLALWSPTGNDLTYVLDNNIYHMTFNHDQRVVRRLTTSGKPGIIYNGIPDWVYEEEVFASESAMWHSPDGKYLAFATFNNTEVKDIIFSHYGNPGSLEDQYPTEVDIKYPKAGTRNPTVSLSVIDLTNSSSKPVILKVPVGINTSDHILYTVSWWDERHVIATWTNRVQNQSQMIMYDIQGNGKPILYDEETKGWLQPNSPIRIKDYALLLHPEDSGTSAGKFRHINRYEYTDGQFVKPVDLTPGPSEVHKILAADSLRDKVYYLATAPGKPTQRNLYSVPLDGSQKPTCISCEQLTPEGNKCLYATASFSSHWSYYSLTCSGPDPSTVTINNERHQPVMLWRKNNFTRALLSQRLFPLQKDFNITVNGYDSRVRLLLPPDFDENKSYPMLVFVYGGPNSAKITDNASKFGYEYYLTTNRKIICAWIDGRGSAYKGSNMLFEIYRKMGTVEVEDTIAVTAILQERYKWIDAKRTGIWGWSYGGFTTGMAMAKDVNSTFKCGISVAPVTSWIYYDSIYTERYMGLPTPEDNLAGYNGTDLSRRSKGFRGKKFMLIHGSADDNVHYQQAMALVKALEHYDILFEQVMYTDEAHSLINVSPHLYHTMDKFWGECFGWNL